MATSSSSSSLPSILNPCHQVRRTCNVLMEDPKSPVSIQDDKILAFLAADNTTTSTTNSNRLDDAIEWDAEGWHYNANELDDDDQSIRKERVALYILALDAINFCFWPTPPNNRSSSSSCSGNTLEYHHLAIALTKLAKRDKSSNNTNKEEEYFFSPQNLSTLTEAEMMSSLQPYLDGHYLPNLPERCRLWNELGAVLLDTFDGKAMTLLHACHGSAPKLVQLLVQYLSGFRDETVAHGGRWCAFYKRAQIAVADLNAALDLDLQDMHQLTTFADYRVPQLLRHVDILQYNSELATKIDAKMELSHDHEVYVRAATVVAVDRLVQAYRLTHDESSTSSTNMTAVKMDWYLWQVGERLNQDGKMKPHHRVITIFY